MQILVFFFSLLYFQELRRLSSIDLIIPYFYNQLQPQTNTNPIQTRSTNKKSYLLPKLFLLLSPLILFLPQSNQQCVKAWNLRIQVVCVCASLRIPMWIYIAASVNLITAVFEVQQDCQMSVMLIIILILGVPKSPVHLYIMQCDIWRWTRVLWHLVPVICAICHLSL